MLFWGTWSLWGGFCGIVLSLQGKLGERLNTKTHFAKDNTGKPCRNLNKINELNIAPNKLYLEPVQGP